MNKDDRVVDSNGRTGTFYRYDKYRDGTFAMVKFDDAMTLRRSEDSFVDELMAPVVGLAHDGDLPGDDGILGVDELHIVSTEFKSMLSQTAAALRIAPLVVEYVGEPETGPHTLFSFEPSADNLFDALLPRYIATRVYAALLEAAALARSRSVSGPTWR